MYSEDDFFMLSALQHFAFCPRQCAIIHKEQHWNENRFTAEGRIMHERVDTPGQRSSPKIKQEYAVYLRSEKLGIYGRADVVEYHLKNNIWIPYPVEYKRGKPKEDKCDEVQLCAQAICLEEMTKCHIPEASLFYEQNKHRLKINIDDNLRNLTVSLAESIHSLLTQKDMPIPSYTPAKCDRCSLIDYCQPKTSDFSFTQYIKDFSE